jgi:hypothetical protein
MARGDLAARLQEWAKAHPDVKLFGEVVDVLDIQARTLGEIYRETGADTDGNEAWRNAPYALEEVRRLRAEHDAQTAQIAALKEQQMVANSLTLAAEVERDNARDEVTALTRKLVVEQEKHDEDAYDDMALAKELAEARVAVFLSALSSLVTKLDAKDAQVAALTEQIENLLRRGERRRAEVERLRAALKNYGRHDGDCNRHYCDDYYEDDDSETRHDREMCCRCDCGFQAALAASETEPQLIGPLASERNPQGWDEGP